MYLFMRTFVMGDLHGALKAMQQVFSKASFDYENDRLIQIGDVVDGWPQSAECVEELLKIKNIVAIRGNHDVWVKDWLKAGYANTSFSEPSVKSTMDNYYRNQKQHDAQHLEFFEKQLDYFVDEEQRLFVHAGYDPTQLISTQEASLLNNSRVYYRMMQWAEQNALEFPFDINGFSEVFIGHSPTIKDYNHDRPVHIQHLWNVDQGCKSRGRLTLMNVETKEYVQSDIVQTLYAEPAAV